MSSREIIELEDMFNRVMKEEESTKLLKKAKRLPMKPRRSRPRQREPNVSMTGKIFSKPKKYSRLLEMRENLAKAEEIRRKLRQKEDEDEEEFKSITSSSESDSSVRSKDFKSVQLVDSDEELLKTFESSAEPEPTINQTINKFVGVDGLPVIKKIPDLLPGELPQNPESLFQELENNDAFYRDIFEHSPSQNMGEILTPIISDYEEPPIDMEELYDLALIETDEQLYEENYLRHSMALAVFEDKNIDELKELLENIKKQPL